MRAQTPIPAFPQGGKEAGAGTNGEFMMGGKTGFLWIGDEKDRYGGEGPVHKVRIATPLFVSV